MLFLTSGWSFTLRPEREGPALSPALSKVPLWPSCSCARPLRCRALGGQEDSLLWNPCCPPPPAKLSSGCSGLWNSPSKHSWAYINGLTVTFYEEDHLAASGDLDGSLGWERGRRFQAGNCGWDWGLNLPTRFGCKTLRSPLMLNLNMSVQL